jgi:hypothetical protein
VNEELEAVSLQDRELRRQSLLSELKSKIEATEQRYQDEQKSKVTAVTEKKETDTENAETPESKLAKNKKLV